MTLYNGVDAAFPGAALPAGTQILAAYIGEPTDPGPPDTPHIWTAAEWNSYLTVAPQLRFLPVYVHNYAGDAVADATNAANAATELGWIPGKGRLIAFDLETFVDPPYVTDFDANLKQLGFETMPYGSAFYVDQNPPCAGRWVAQLTANPPRSLPAGAIGQQWKFGGSWDYDVFSQYVYDNCGRGPRT